MSKDSGEAGAQVRAAMSPIPLVFDEGHLLVDALEQMDGPPGGQPVRAVAVRAGDGSFKGLLVKRDVVDALRRHPGDPLTAGQACRDGVCVGVDASIQAARELLAREGVARMPVVDGRNLVGEISRHGIEHFLERQRRQSLEPHQRSQVRWRGTRPHTGLTWGMELSGEAFIAKAESYGAFDARKTILEIGPGYGRLLRECLARDLPFRKYVAVDLSEANVAYLTGQFRRDDVEVIEGNIETVSLEERFDVVLSSLTLKHLYPTFETAFRNLERYLSPGATLVFDLIEGDAAEFLDGGVTYMRCYSRAEVEAILAAASLELVAFDEIEHAPGQARLLVVARKPG